MTKRLIVPFCCFTMLLTACSSRALPRITEFYPNSSSVSAVSGSGHQQASSSLPPQAFDDAFLKQAYQVGYTDEMLETLKQQEFTSWQILNPSTINTYHKGQTTPDGKYSLASYEVVYILSAMLVVDNTTGEFNVVGDWQNGYCDFGILDNNRFYAAVPEVGGATYPAGLRIYGFDNPAQPIARWDLTTAPNAATTKLMLPTYYHMASGLFAVFHCEYPSDWDVWTQDSVTNYQVTILNTDCNVLFTVDTGIPLEKCKTGIAAPSFEKYNDPLDEQNGIIYFCIGESYYRLDCQTQAVDAWVF